MNRSFIIEWTPRNACRRRYLFEPQNGDAWLRTEKKRSGEEWTVIEQEQVTGVRLECPNTDSDTGVETYRGP